MKDLLKLAIFIAACELTGLAGTPFTVAAIPTWYASLNKPPFAPPNWVFGPAWLLLYFLMGTALFLIWQKGLEKKEVKIAVTFFAVQLVFNALWSPIFFGLKNPLLGLFDIVAMWLAIAATMTKFYPLSKPAFFLMLPYLLWVSFATALNAAILWLN